jgi:tryptophanase
MTKEFKTHEEWKQYYFPNGMPEAASIPQLTATTPKAIELLNSAALQLQNHALEYSHPGQHQLIKDIKEYIDRAPVQSAPVSSLSVDIYVDGGMITGGHVVPDGVENGDHTVYFDAPTTLSNDERQTIEASAAAVEAYGNTGLAAKLRHILEIK